MIEGQYGLSWQRWSHICRLAEELGFSSLFRSDHYFIRSQQDSLATYISLAVAAKETRRVRLGPLVSPITFRSPIELARMAAQIDILRRRRFVMGLGAGWYEDEHFAYDIPFPPLRERLDRLEDAIKLMKALWRPGRTTYEGQFYRVDGVECLPKSGHGRPPVLIGGSGEKRTLGIVARHADEWNCIDQSRETYLPKTQALERHCDAVGRDPRTIRRSVMMFCLVGPSVRAINAVTRRYMEVMSVSGSTSLRSFQRQARPRGMIVGWASDILERLEELAALGVQEVQFQHMDFDSDDLPRFLAEEVIPAARDL